MTWISDNWLVILLGAGFIGFHLFGHRGHGGHGGGHKHGSGARADSPPFDADRNPPSDVSIVPDPDTAAEEDSATRPPKPGGHQH